MAAVRPGGRSREQWLAEFTLEKTQLLAEAAFVDSQRSGSLMYRAVAHCKIEGPQSVGAFKPAQSWGQDGGASGRRHDVSES